MWVREFIIVLIFIIAADYFIFKKYVFSRLTFQRSFSKTGAFPGENIDLIEQLSNDKILPVPFLRVESNITSNLVFNGDQTQTGKQDSKKEITYHAVFSLMPRTITRRRYTMNCKKRGYYPFHTVHLTARGLFGLGSELQRDVETQCAVFVYPNLLTLGELEAKSGSFTGDVIVRRLIVEDPFLLRGVREYMPFDPMSRINWSATAKTGALQVHEYDFSQDLKMKVFLNILEKPDQWNKAVESECIETGISIAATIMQFTAQNGISAAFSSNATMAEMPEDAKAEIGFGADICHLTETMELMARLNQKDRVSISALLEEEADAACSPLCIILITAYIDDKTRAQIDRLRKNGSAVEIIPIDTAGAMVSEREA